MQTELLIIDMQNDFCDPSGSLFVPGADKDCERLAKMISRVKDKIDDIHVTLDSHRRLDIAHPMMWIDSQGNHPNPFTIISVSDVENGVWSPVNPSWRNKVREYVQKLQDNNRYPLCIWPEHCLIGSWGYGINPFVFQALCEWEAQVAMVDFVTKGSNPWTEHYGILQSECPEPDDPSTQLNISLINTLQSADIVGIGGEAKSHCVNFSTSDIVDNFGSDNIEKIWLIEDAMSSVPGFEDEANKFIDRMTKLGAHLTTSDKFLS